MKYIKLLILICWMSTIFIFSNQPSYTSTKTSDSVILGAVSIVEKVSGHTYTELEKEKIINNYVVVTRKGAHFFVYLILGILIIWNLSNYFPINKKVIITGMILALLYACSDEIHQMFVSGRSSEIRDVIIDTSGATIGIFIYYVVNKKFVLKRNKM